MKNPVHALVVTVCTVCAGLLHPAVAQVRPDAGQTLRDAEKSLPIPPAAPTPKVFLPVDPRVDNAPDSVSVGMVEKFNIGGAGLIPAEELMVTLQPWLHRALTFSDLKAAADAVTRVYRERGYPVARAYIPEQTIEDHVVAIEVMVSHRGRLTLNNSSPIADQRLQAHFDALPAGAVLRSPALERGLLLVQDLAGVASVTATLQPGAGAGETDVLVNVERAPGVAGAVDLDNYGNRYTGRYRGGVTLNVNSPAGLGDQLAARLQASNQELLYGQVNYRVPVGSAGNVVGASFSKSRYQLGGTFAPLDANGTARASSLFTSYPLLRSQSFNLVGSVAAERKTLEDRIDAIESVNHKSLHQVTASLAASGAFDRGGGYSTSAAISHGEVSVKADPAQPMDAAGASGAGSYTKLAYSASALWPLAGPWSMLALGNGQLSNKNLDSSEKFSLGGAEAVRAYPQGEATGDDGVFVSSELRYEVPAPAGLLRFGAFLDYGVIKTSHTAVPGDDNRRHLAAYGFSLNWNVADDFIVKGTLARRLGHQPSTAERDASSRFWLQAVKNF